MSGVTPAFRALLGKLKTYEVRWWGEAAVGDDGDGVTYEPGVDRLEADLRYANVVSSELKPKPRLATSPASWQELLETPERRHVVALDIDYPAHLISSTTAGHSHLYLEVPGGVAHEDYMELLAILGRIGVIEPGYADVSIKRGHTDLRLPWIQKGEPARNEFHPEAVAPDPWDGWVYSEPKAEPV